MKTSTWPILYQHPDEVLLPGLSEKVLETGGLDLGDLEFGRCRTAMYVLFPTTSWGLSIFLSALRTLRRYRFYVLVQENCWTVLRYTAVRILRFLRPSVVLVAVIMARRDLPPVRTSLHVKDLYCGKLNLLYYLSPHFLLVFFSFDSSYVCFSWHWDSPTWNWWDC